MVQFCIVKLDAGLTQGEFLRDRSPSLVNGTRPRRGFTCVKKMKLTHARKTAEHGKVGKGGFVAVIDTVAAVQLFGREEKFHVTFPLTSEQFDKIVENARVMLDKTGHVTKAFTRNKHGLSIDVAADTNQSPVQYEDKPILLTSNGNMLVEREVPLFDSAPVPRGFFAKVAYFFGFRT